MGESILVLVLIGILILGTLGLTQNAFAQQTENVPKFVTSKHNI